MGERCVKQAFEYRQHAAECRKLALNARNEAENRQLLEMEAAWERMAAERERRIAMEGRKDIVPAQVAISPFEARREN